MIPRIAYFPICWLLEEKKRNAFRKEIILTTTNFALNMYATHTLDCLTNLHWSSLSLPYFFLLLLLLLLLLLFRCVTILQLYRCNKIKIPWKFPRKMVEYEYSTLLASIERYIIIIVSSITSLLSLVLVTWVHILFRYRGLVVHIYNYNYCYYFN